MVFHHLITPFGFRQDKRHSPLGGETTFNYHFPKVNPSKFDNSLWLNEDDPKVKRRMATKKPKDLEGISVSNYDKAHDRHFYSKAGHNVVEKE
jgi:hypothetical protein